MEEHALVTNSCFSGCSLFLRLSNLNGINSCFLWLNKRLFILMLGQIEIAMHTYVDTRVAAGGSSLHSSLLLLYNVLLKQARHILCPTI